jgi:hypothetical protein
VRERRLRVWRGAETRLQSIILPTLGRLNEVNTRNDVLLATGIRSQNQLDAPRCLWRSFTCRARLTLFSDDKPDRLNRRGQPSFTTAAATRFRSARSSESRSTKIRLLSYSTIIVTNRSPVRVHEIAFLLRFGGLMRNEENPLNSPVAYAKATRQKSR